MSFTHNMTPDDVEQEYCQTLQGEWSNTRGIVLLVVSMDHRQARNDDGGNRLEKRLLLPVMS